jgi:hypothetical protein
MRSASLARRMAHVASYVFAATHQRVLVTGGIVRTICKAGQDVCRLRISKGLINKSAHLVVERIIVVKLVHLFHVRAGSTDV